MNLNPEKSLKSDYVKTYYDSFLSTYDKEYGYYRWAAGPVERLHFKQTKRALAPYLKMVVGQVLEVGGGDGIWTKEYIDHINHLTFVDISTEMVSRAQKRLAAYSGKISYTNADFLQNNLINDSFDSVVSIRNLEYFTDKDKFIAEAMRLLKHGGSLLLVTKSPKYNLRDDAKNKTLHTAQIGIIELLALLKSHGFKVVAVRPAIFGKLFRFTLMRSLSSMIQYILLIIPQQLVPLRLLSYLSESFVIYVKK